MQAPTGADPPGYARGELRAARYDGAYWSGVGFPLNRNVQAPLRLPVAGATPAGDDRCHRQRHPRLAGARRPVRRPRSGRGGCSAANAGIATQVSPGDLQRSAAPRSGGPVLARRRRLRPGRDRLSPAARRGRSAQRHADHARDDPGDIGADASRRSARRGSSTARVRRRRRPAGPPAVAVDRVGDTLTAFGFAQRSVLVGCRRQDRAARRAPRRRAHRDRPATRRSPTSRESGAAVAAWLIRRGSAGGIGVTERRADGVPVSQALSAPAGGAVSSFALAGSGLGDAARRLGPGRGHRPPDRRGGRRRAAGPVRRATRRRTGCGPCRSSLGHARARDRRRHVRRHARRRHGRRGRSRHAGSSCKAADVDDGDNVLQVIAEPTPADRRRRATPAELKLDRRKPPRGKSSAIATGSSR